VIAEIATTTRANLGPPNADPTARLPGAALRRWISVRDRTCVFPGCRVPAHRADADHTTEHARGGSTTDDNLGPGCRHDHRLRHDGGWRIVQTRPIRGLIFDRGRMRWQ
jgi:HNH endonuclease